MTMYEQFFNVDCIILHVMLKAHPSIPYLSITDLSMQGQLDLLATREFSADGFISISCNLSDHSSNRVYTGRTVQFLFFAVFGSH